MCRLLGNMDETPVYFDMVPGKTVDVRGKKTIKVRMTESEKRHITVFSPSLPLNVGNPYLLDPLNHQIFIHPCFTLRHHHKSLWHMEILNRSIGLPFKDDHWWEKLSTRHTCQHQKNSLPSRSHPGCTVARVI